MAAPAGDVLALATKLQAQTGDRGQTVAGLTGLGFTRAQALAAVDQVAPVPAQLPAPASSPVDTRPVSSTTSTPAPKRAAKAPASRTTAKGTRKAPTPPTAGAGTGRGLFSTSRAGRGSAGSSLPSPRLSLPRRPDAGDVGGFMFGLLLYMLGLQFIKHGPDGPKGWLGAKLLNRPFVPAPDDGPGGDTTNPGRGDFAGGLTSTRPAPPLTV